MECEGTSSHFHCPNSNELAIRPFTNDNVIRRQLRQQLSQLYLNDPDTFILEELGLRHGHSRIDIVVVNGFLHGFEIKSDRDTLRRLARQTETYGRVLDLVTLVAGERHAEQALRVVPQWWGIQIAQGRDNELRIAEVRKPSQNPSPDKLAIAKLLWREEALNFLEELGAAGGFRSKPRRFIYSRLAEVAEINRLRQRVRDRLRLRKDWRSAEQQKSSGG